MHERRAGQVTVYVTDTSTNTVQRKPQHKILGAVGTIESDHLATLNAQIIYQPIPHSLEVLEELAIRP